jgi:hypothetical protein
MMSGAVLEDGHMTAPPRILITGLLRTGSTRLYNIAREALLARHAEARVGHFTDVADLERTLSSPGPLLFKEHMLTASIQERVLDGDVVAVATLREPLPALVSLCSTFQWPAQVAVRETDRALVSLEEIAEAAKIYTYRSATDGNPAMVRRILTDAGLPAGWAESARLAHRWGRRNAEKHSTQIAGRETGRWDAETLFHPGHVGGARTVDERTLAALTEAVRTHSLDQRVAALEAVAF